MSGTQNASTAVGTQPYFEVPQHEDPAIFNRGYDQQDNQQIMNDANGNMTWPISDSMLSSMSTMLQVSDSQSTELAPREEEAAMIGFWDDDFGRLEPPMNDNSGQSGWFLPLANS
ncbi:hypothetical protein E4U41_002237 [Claviceps citrina]|nr:hypothetical protein E4U41_002237 [Claviceps citrina]